MQVKYPCIYALVLNPLFCAVFYYTIFVLLYTPLIPFSVLFMHQCLFIPLCITPVVFWSSFIVTGLPASVTKIMRVNLDLGSTSVLQSAKVTTQTVTS